MRNTKLEAAGARSGAGARTGLLAILLCASCRTIDAKAWNLNQLHNETGGHQYHGALESDLEYLIRHQLLPLVLFNRASLAEKSSESIKNPATECLDNLIKLEDHDPDDPVQAGIQVQWFARLAVDDVAQLSRERAVLGLGRAGKRLSAGLPVKLAKDVTPAGAEATSTTLAGLVNAIRPRVQRREPLDATERANLEAACQVVGALPLDIEGARRALRVATDLMRVVGGKRTQDLEPLFALGDELQRSCVRQALAQALLDREEVVRAAAVEACVECAGSEVLDSILGQLSREPSPVVIMRVLQVVERVGLPALAPDLEPGERDRRRELWLSNVYGLLLTRPESEIHVSAMITLSKVSGSGIESLREEDWQAWWRARSPAKDASQSASPNG